ncbi:mitochondrial mRNA pseudouridine synthase RPUSD3 isoform X2 [Anabrus simplex]|uniref:mitochondrial mRNA pseudouridine synthase RPUSD3 isoform X2 n=1 Tax=Anabrus simplex TaxID=316456 RepID=UPI0035A35861
MVMTTHDDGLVIINKPYGVGSHQPCKTSMGSAVIEDNLNTATSDSNNFYLSTVLPQISEALGYPKLTIVKASERFTSGITILSAREEVTSRVQKCMKKSKHQQYLSNSYLAVVLGSPKPPALSQKVGLKLETNPLDGGKQPVIMNEWSRNAVSRKEVFPITVKHMTLQQSHLASLVELQPSLNKWHFLRVYMAYLLSPILGDNLYGSRVRNVLGVPLSVSPFSDTAKQSQRLSKEVLAALDLKPSDEVIIPTHLHLHQVTLLDYKGKGRHLQVLAPLPESFLWTCRQLHLRESLQMSLSHS